jgi:hypothetical protein
VSHWPRGKPLVLGLVDATRHVVQCFDEQNDVLYRFWPNRPGYLHDPP